MSESHIQWVVPAPFWSTLLPSGGAPTEGRFLRPELLRFASDSFMDEFLALLEHEPARLGELRARRETWRAPMRPLAPLRRTPLFARALTRQHALPAAPTLATAQPTSNADPEPDIPLKLYQPGHQRFYMVCACLVCRVPGLPDRALDLPAQERASFVLRLLRPPTGAGAATQIDPEACDEYAFVGAGHSASWQKLAGERRALVAGEEQLPLFGVQFPADGGRRRRLLAGMVPVGKRECYMGARERAAAAEANADDVVQPRAALEPRAALILSQVIEPWRQLIYRMDLRAGQIADDPPAGLNKDPSQWASQRKEAREQAQTISWYLLLDLADALATYLPEVWDAVKRGSSSLVGAQGELYDALESIRVPPQLRALLLAADGTSYTTASFWPSLRVALAEIGAFQARLEGVNVPYTRTNPPTGWPNRLFPLADPQAPGPLYDADATDHAAPVSALFALIQAAMPAEATMPLPELPLVAQQALGSNEPAWFTIRCVFERPACGPLVPTLVSEATEPFQIAAFFDPDAPARPIRIAMPVDISPGGLRKFSKNTAFVLSDMLCGQVNRLGGLSLGDLVRSVLPWPLHKDLSADTGPCQDSGLSFGMICSISIPIITICALILLMIIVSLLDLIFRWIPFFILCLPLPGFKARRGAL